MKKTNFGKMQCSLARGLDLIGDWWTPLIIRDIFLGVRRFDRLVANLGISRNLLTARLSGLSKSKIIKKVKYNAKPPRFEYELTDMGRDLVPVIVALTAWGEKWARPKEGSPVLFRHQACGHIFSAEIVCSQCRGDISFDSVTAIPGPGGRSKPGTLLIGRTLEAVSPRPQKSRLPARGRDKSHPR